MFVGCCNFEGQRWQFKVVVVVSCVKFDFGFFFAGFNAIRHRSLVSQCDAMFEIQDASKVKFAIIDDKVVSVPGQPLPSLSAAKSRPFNKRARPALAFDTVENGSDNEDAPPALVAPSATSNGPDQEIVRWQEYLLSFELFVLRVAYRQRKYQWEGDLLLPQGCGGSRWDTLQEGAQVHNS